MSESTEKLLLDSDGAPRDRIVGFETEYGFHVRNASRVDTTIAIDKVVTFDRRTRDGSEFEETGERIYVDIGPHPEYSTAEETLFLGAAYRQLSGHVKMARRYKIHNQTLLEDPDFDNKKAAIDLVANTCDASGSTWGNHENYLAPRNLEPSDYKPALIVHHLSRIVWSGAGHIQETARGPRFVLSEKADHIWQEASTSTTSSRPLVNLRDVPYADPERFRRIHNVSGESVISPFVNALRLASGSIVLRACELGVQFDDLLPENPLRSIREISNDPKLKAEVKLIDGRKMTGLQLQKKIADRSINAVRKAKYITGQEELWADKWLLLLDDLASNPESCIQRLNWMVKQKLIERELQNNKQSKESQYEVAWLKSQDFHRILPAEGNGMKLLRRGFFEDSPSLEVLENGLPLPATRASVRGYLIKSLRARGHDVAASWTAAKSRSIVGPTIVLKDPYATTDPRVEAFLKKAS